MDSPLRIGILRGGSLGDNLNNTAYLAGLKRAFPYSDVTMYVTRHPEIFKNNPCVNSVKVVGNNTPRGTINELIKNFDIFLEMHYAGKWHFSENALKIKDVVSFKEIWEKKFQSYSSSFEQFLFNINTTLALKEKHYDISINSSNLDCSIEDMFLFIGPDDYTPSNKYQGFRYVVINNSSLEGFCTKNWEDDSFKELSKYLNSFGFYVIHAGQPGESDLGANDFFTGTIFETAALIKGAVFCVFPEGGLSHVAKTVGVDSIILFGSTTPELFGYDNNINLRSSVCNTPCFWKNYRWMKYCQKEKKDIVNKAALCMKELKVSTVCKAVNQLLERKGFKMNYVEPNENMTKAVLEVSLWHKSHDICGQSINTPNEKIEMDAFQNKLDSSFYSDKMKQVNQVLDYVGFNRTILDLSGDDGFIASLLKNQNNNILVGGFSKIRLLRAKLEYKLSTFLIDSTALEFADNSFDIVILPSQFTKVYSKTNLLSECQRVCSKKGEIILYFLDKEKGNDKNIELINSNGFPIISFKNDDKENAVVVKGTKPGFFSNLFGASNKQVSFGDAITAKLNHIGVGVPEGIGDILWVYRKIKPYCNTMTITINHTNQKSTGLLQTLHERSVKVIESFPGVTAVNHKYGFRQWTKEKMKLKYIFDAVPAKASVSKFDFICNKFLEEGVCLEDIDKELEVCWDMKLPVEPNDAVKDILGKYLMVFVAEYTTREGQDKSLKLWTTDEWVDFIDNLLKANNLDVPIVLTGAEFDRATQNLVGKGLAARNRTVIMSIGETPEKLFYTIKNCRYFIGYQSGLNMLADEFGTKQLIMYFPTLRNMKDSWVKPENRTNGTFTYAYFDDDKNDIIKKVNLCINNQSTQSL